MAPELLTPIDLGLNHSRKKLHTALRTEFSASVDQNGFYRLPHVQSFLEWATMNDYNFHASSRKIKDMILPQPAFDHA